MKIELAKASLPVLNFLVAQIEGYNVGVLTAAETVAFQSEGETDPEKLKWIEETFGKDKPKPCFITSFGDKYTTSTQMMANTGCAGMQFTSNWNQAGSIIEREGLWVRESAVASPAIAHLVKPENKWFAYPSRKYEGGDHAGCQYGETFLIAAMRSYVASKLGAFVEVPDELVAE